MKKTKSIYEIKTRAISSFILLLMVIFLSACGTEDTNSEPKNEEKAPTERTITDATGEKKIPANPKRVAATSQQLMEFLIPLDLNVRVAPKATIADEFYSYFPEDKQKNIILVGDSSPLNFEGFLAQQPDLIFVREDTQSYDKMSKIAPAIMIKETKDWRTDLKEYARIMDKESEAKAYLDNYQNQVDGYKEELKSTVGNEKVVFIRLLDKEVRIYNNLPTSVGGVMYHDLGLTPVEGIESKDLFSAISLEKLLEMNPDHIFVQTGKQDEKPEVSQKRLEEITKGDIWKSLNAFKNNHVYVEDASFFNNTPMSQLNTAKIITETLNKN
ncbi:MAG: ABC transporter substrate-binding protein [Bacillus sp. (in: firmicutes)]